MKPVRIPANKAADRKSVLKRMRAARDQDARWKEGRAFSLVFYGGEELYRLIQDAYLMFFSENGLNPGAFPSLKEFEAEVVSMTAGVLGGKREVCGHMTSGGTESILLAVKTARDWSRKHRPEVTQPEIIVPTTAHPAFDKAGHYFDVAVRHVPVRRDYRADVAAMEAAVTDQTILLVGSAPAYPQGVVDPIRELGELARRRDLLLHVDACVGGFLLPWVKKLGYPVPDFDFSVPGVTSLSVDLHKYAYAAKGASVILYRTRELRRSQLFVYADWPGGIYGSPSILGTRPGGSIAAAWAVLNYLGEEGYLEINRTVMETARRIQTGVAQIPGLCIQGQPEASVMAIGAESIPSKAPEGRSKSGTGSGETPTGRAERAGAPDIYAVGDELSARGWHLDRQQNPPGLHLSVNYAHAASVDEFLRDLRAAAEASQKTGARLGSQAGAFLGRFLTVLPKGWSSALTRMLAKLGGGGTPKRSAALYGMMGELPDRGDLHEMVKDLLEGFVTPTGRIPKD